MYKCSKGCQSTDADYCSNCGAKMEGAQSGLSAPPICVLVAPPKEMPCPDCGAPRHPPDAVFCELCRYDFVKRVASPNAVRSAPVAPQQNAPAEAPKPISQPQATNSYSHWEAEVCVEPAMFAPEAEISCPSDQTVRMFPLDIAEMLIGRRSDVRDIHPEIPINDDAAISHRHAKLLRMSDGGYQVIDLGSNNGTHLNGTDLIPGVRVPLKNGDEIRLGRWTLIRIKAH